MLSCWQAVEGCVNIAMSATVLHYHGEKPLAVLAAVKLAAFPTPVQEEVSAEPVALTLQTSKYAHSLNNRLAKCRFTREVPLPTSITVAAVPIAAINCVVQKTDGGTVTNNRRCVVAVVRNL